MKAAGYGRVINISSSAGRTVSTLGGAHYTASKAGLLGLTRAAAKELGKFGITVNAMCPGMIDTELTHENASPELLERLAASYPVPRLGTAVEVADLICFLASEAGRVHDRRLAGHHGRRLDDVASSSQSPHERKYAGSRGAGRGGGWWALIGASGNDALLRAADSLAPIGVLWVNAIRMTVIPLVVSLLITGVASASDVKAIGRIGGRTLVVFLLLIVAIAIVMIRSLASRSRCSRRTPARVPRFPPARRRRRGSGGRSEADVRDLADVADPEQPDRGGRKRRDGATDSLHAVARARDRSQSGGQPRDAGRFLPRAWRRDADAGAMGRDARADRRLRARAATGGSRRRDAGWRDRLLHRRVHLSRVSSSTAAALSGRSRSSAEFRCGSSRAPRCPPQLIAFSSSSSIASLPALVESAERGLGLPSRVSGFVLPLAVSTFKVAGAGVVDDRGAVRRLVLRRSARTRASSRRSRSLPSFSRLRRRGFRAARSSC